MGKYFFRYIKIKKKKIYYTEVKVLRFLIMLKGLIWYLMFQ